jgi:cellulose synthase/poly-beta-1,6-N-acetylglucosamine synthase-like glycosyltransferase
VTGCALATVLVAVPGLAIFTFDVALSLIFLAWAVLRLSAALIESPQTSLAARLPDSELPVYSILVPLYREANSVRGLIAALRKLDYPREKLDIKLIIERDDQPAVARRRISNHCRA